MCFGNLNPEMYFRIMVLEVFIFSTPSISDKKKIGIQKIQFKNQNLIPKK